MKYFLFLFLPLLFQTEMVEAAGDSLFSEKPLDVLLVQARAERKLLFVDCYTTWCGPCRKMTAEVFPDSAVTGFMKANFISVKIDMEKGDGILLGKKWDVGAYPTFIVLDNSGSVKFRLTGFFPARQFVDTLKCLMNGRSADTAVSLYKSGDRSADVVLRYISELENNHEERTLEEAAGSFCDDNCSALPYDSLLYSIFRKYVRNPHRKSFLYAYSHRDAIATEYGPQSIEAMELVWRMYAKNFYVTDSETGQLEGVDTKGMGEYERFMIENGVRNAAEYTMYYKLPASFILKDKPELMANLRQAAFMPDVSQSQFDYACTVLEGMLVNKKEKKELRKIREQRQKITLR